MKKTLLTIFGIALFLAGSAYTQQQAEYVAHQKQDAVRTNGGTGTTQISPQLKHTVAYQLVKNR